MKIAFNPSTVAALTTPPDNKDITFDLRGQNIFARGVKFYGTDTNTWRDIKINNVSIGSNVLDLRNGSNTTLTNTDGVVTINSTWRPVVDNLTSNSTTSSLSANQGRILAGLINGKSDSDHNHDGRYLRLSGQDTMQGNLYLHSYGTSYIGKGLGDKSGADFTEANIVIRSQWGISFKSYDDVVRTYIDTRTGNIGTKGVLNAVGAVIQGRVYNNGDDEGIIIKPYSNGCAGLILGTHNGERSVFYLLKGDPLWRYNNGSTSFDIYHPKKPGIIALTSDIPSKDSWNYDDRYLKLTGGWMSGDINFGGDNKIHWGRNTDSASISFKNDGDADSYMSFVTSDNGNEYFRWSHIANSTNTEWMALRSDGLRVRGTKVSLEGHTHDDRYYTKAESNAKYITDITTSVNKLTFTRNGANIARNITVNVVYSQGNLTNIPNEDATTKANPGLFIYDSYEQTIGTNSYSSVLSINTGGTIQIAGNWGDDQARNLYWRSQSKRNVTDYPWKSWRTILDSENYSFTLDSRYYTESEVNSLLDAKLNRQNLSYGGWNPRGYNLAADYCYNGGDLSISEHYGQIHVSIDGYFWQNEGRYRVLDTSDISDIRGGLTLHQYLSATDATWYPLVWGGGSHTNASDSTGGVHKSYDKLSWQTSSQTLYATNIQTNNIKYLTVGGGIYWNPYVESGSDGSDAASITLVRSGVAGGITLVLSQQNDTNDTIQFQTNPAARLYHNSYPILTTQNTYVNNNKGYINGAEITQVNNADLLDGLHSTSFAPYNGVKFGHRPDANIWHRILQFTTNWVGQVTFMYSPEECQRSYWGIFNINIRIKDIWFRGFSFANLPQIKCCGDDNNNWSVWIKGSANNYDPYGVIQILNFSNASIVSVGLNKSQTTEPSGTYNKAPDLFQAGSVNWSDITNKIVAGHEFNIVNSGFNNDMYFNYLPINDRNSTATISNYIFGNGHRGQASLKASGFIKNGSSDSYVLLGGGGHKLESALNVASASVASKVFGQVGDTGSHELVRCDMNNDQFRIIAGSNGNNNGWAEIATANDGTEPIYVRQYAGVFSSVVRTLTLLDAHGFTHFPSYINIGGNENNNSSPDRVWGSNSSDSFLRSYRTSALRVAYAASAGNAETLGGFPKNYGQAPFGTIPCIENDGVMEIGRYIDFHYDNSGSYDYSTRLQTNGNYRNIVRLPSASGTLALISQVLTWKSQIIDMRNYSESYWHPVTVPLPYNGYNKIKVSVQLNSGDKPSWATHSNGITCNMEIWATADGWGTTDSDTICLNYTYKFCSQNPCGWMQLGNPSLGVVFLRGGSRYTVYTDFDATFTPHNQKYTWGSGDSSQDTGGPYTSCPGLNFNMGTIRADLIATQVQARRVCAGHDPGIDNSISCSNWFRSSGNTGWYNTTYYGGWYMSDTSWIRAFNGVGIYTSGQIYSSSSIKMGNILLEHTDEINNVANAGIHLNYRNSGIVSLCYGGGRVGIGTMSPTQKLDVAGNIRVTGQIVREGSSQRWVNGRDGALLRETSVAGYHTLWSLKTTDGSWDFGEFHVNSDWNNIPVLSYIKDSNYNSGNNVPTYQIKFPLASGTVALTSQLPSQGGDESHPIFLGYLNLYHGDDGTVSSYFSCLGYSVPFTYTRGGNYCRIIIPDTTHLSFYVRAATASVNYSGGGMDTWVGNHRGTGAWWLHCYAYGWQEVRVKGFRLANSHNDSWWGGNPLYSYQDGANIITVCIFGYVRFK